MTKVDRSDPIGDFRRELAELDDAAYPPGVIPVPEQIDGTAFFSAGPGLYCEQQPSEHGLPPCPFGGAMFVGHNLDAEVPYRRRLELGMPHGDRRRPMRTWRGLYALLEAADVDVHRCFFTNAYVGLIAGDKPVGRFPGAADKDFTSWCAAYLRYQIDITQPLVLATLGADARRFVGTLSADLAEWSLRGAPALRVHDVHIGGHPVRAIHLAHPSMYPVSAKARWFEGSSGMAADAALLRAAAHW